MGEDRAQEALDHLQAAALELIAAVRAVLDVAEEAVREPQAVLEVLSATVRAASEAATTISATNPPGAAAAAGEEGADESPTKASGRGGVQHIRIS